MPSKKDLGILFSPLLITLFFLFFWGGLILFHPFFPVEPVIEEQQATLAFIGDLMVHQAQLNDAQDSLFYHFEKSFYPIQIGLKEPDLTVGNLETTISNAVEGYGGYPLFQTPESFITALKDAGVDLLTTANNHSFDGADFGIDKTLEAITRNRLATTGTIGGDQKPKEKVPLITEVNGIRIAHFAYTYATNGNSWKLKGDGAKWKITKIDDYPAIQKDFDRAKALNADLIIVYPHWGEEYQREPNKKQKAVANKLAKMGADLIIGSHPHVLQPIEWITVSKGKTTKQVFVAWSLGNFIAYMGHSIHPYSDTGMILYIQIKKNRKTQQIEIQKIEYLPTWVHQYRKKGDPKIHFEVLPLYAQPNQLTENQYPLSPANRKRYQQAYLETVKLLKEEPFHPVGID